jgi:hypothetical protein
VGCGVPVGSEVELDVWRKVCAASLLPDVEVTCWVWGP